jgi:alkyldihydroxyacetonephosphate synthase
MGNRPQIRGPGRGGTDSADALSGREALWGWLARQLGMPALLATPPRHFSDIALPPPRLSAAHRTGLAELVGPARLRDDNGRRAAHAGGRGYRDRIALRAGDFFGAPDAVLYPRSETDVLAVLAYCSRHRIAVQPYGGGTSLTGGVHPAGAFAGTVTLDMTMMDRLLTLDRVSGLAIVEAGMRGAALAQQLAEYGLTSGHAPQSFESSTLGGWIAHHGRGLESDGHADWLAQLRVATPNGLLVCGHVPAGTAGPDLKHLMLGSDGAFGVITAATVRLRAAPAGQSFPCWLFPDFAAGLAVVRQATRDGIPHVMLRLSDGDETRLMRAFQTVGRFSLAGALSDFYLRVRGFDDNAALLVTGLAGSDKETGAARKQLGALARRAGAIALGERPGRAWRANRFEMPDLQETLLDRAIGIDTLETAASWSKLPRLYVATRAALDRAMRAHAPRPGAHGLVMTHVARACPDGASLSFTILFPRKLDGEIPQWEAIRRAGIDAIVRAGGSHPQGIGEAQKGALTLDVLAAVKRSFDPEGILNPGKLIPPG